MALARTDGLPALRMLPRLLELIKCEVRAHRRIWNGQDPGVARFFQRQPSAGGHSLLRLRCPAEDLNPHLLPPGSERPLTGTEMYGERAVRLGFAREV